jgi:acyl-CoA synthetase (AMP-forming)/AMP-acid ligase II
MAELGSLWTYTLRKCIEPTLTRAVAEQYVLGARLLSYNVQPRLLDSSNGLFPENELAITSGRLFVVEIWIEGQSL